MRYQIQSALARLAVLGAIVGLGACASPSTTFQDPNFAFQQVETYALTSAGNSAVSRELEIVVGRYMANLGIAPSDTPDIVLRIGTNVTQQRETVSTQTTGQRAVNPLPQTRDLVFLNVALHVQLVPPGAMEPAWATSGNVIVADEVAGFSLINDRLNQLLYRMPVMGPGVPQLEVDDTSGSFELPEVRE